MKIFAILAAVSLAQAAKLDRVYLPPNAEAASGSNGLLQTPLQSANGDYDISANTPIANRNAYGQNQQTPGQSANRDYEISANTPISNRNAYGQNRQTPGQAANRDYDINANTPISNRNAYGQNRLTPGKSANRDYEISANTPISNRNAYGQNLQTPGQSANQDFEINANAPISNTNAYAQNAYSDFDGRPERAQAAFERNAAILRQDNVNDGETYSYAYETENGIYAEENGVATNGVQTQGGYSYTGDDGKVYSVRYTADENGFVPQGDHLPTPPPIPEEILQALEKNARDEAAGIYDDGSYSDVKYADASNGDQQYYNPNAQSINYSDDAVSTNSADYRARAGINGNAKYAAASNNEQQYYNALPKNYNDDTVSSNSAGVRNGQKLNGNSKYAATGNNEQKYFNKNAQSTNYNDDDVNSNAAGLRNGQRINGNSKYASASNNEQRYYNANAQPSNYKNEDAVITDSAAVRNGINGNTKYEAASNNEQRYYNAKPNKYNDEAINTNPATFRNGAVFNGNAVDKTYLPPVDQRNTNTRNGYRY